MAALATSRYWAGVVIVGAVGQTILTTAGCLQAVKCWELLGRRSAIKRRTNPGPGFNTRLVHS
jgi:hypothetical protein